MIIKNWNQSCTDRFLKYVRLPFTLHSSFLSFEIVFSNRSKLNRSKDSFADEPKWSYDGNELCRLIFVATRALARISLFDSISTCFHICCKNGNFKLKRQKYLSFY